MHTVTRFRPTGIMPLVTAAVIASFISGAAVGVAATIPSIAQPAKVDTCTVGDVIACLIEGADDEASEPPQ